MRDKDIQINGLPFNGRQIWLVMSKWSLEQMWTVSDIVDERRPWKNMEGSTNKLFEIKII